MNASVLQVSILICRSFVNTGQPFKGINLVNGNYSWREFLVMSILSIVNTIWMACMTLANQNEKTVFLSIFSYITVCYALFADLIIFDITFKWQHGLGAFIILAISFGLAFRKFIKSRKIEN